LSAIVPMCVRAYACGCMIFSFIHMCASSVCIETACLLWEVCNMLGDVSYEMCHGMDYMTHSSICVRQFYGGCLCVMGSMQYVMGRVIWNVLCDGSYDSFIHMCASSLWGLPVCWVGRIMGCVIFNVLWSVPYSVCYGVCRMTPPGLYSYSTCRGYTVCGNTTDKILRLANSDSMIQNFR